jgi:hypothetical protein
VYNYLIYIEIKNKIYNYKNILYNLLYMGNSITKTDVDKRFNDSLLAQEIKKIMMEYSYSDADKTNDPFNPTYKNIRPHLAKACCKDVIAPGISLKPTSFVSIPFPKPGDLTSTRCKTDGVCFDTEYYGLQIDDVRDKYCGGTGTTAPLAGYNFSITRDGLGNSICDNYMLDYCAKSLYDQGCLSVKKNSAGKLVSQITDSKTNPMCLNVDKKIHYGPPECECLNSMFGPNLNTPPARVIGDNSNNPYGLEGSNTVTSNDYTKYSLSVFKQGKNLQKPRSLDVRCTEGAERGGTVKASAYTLFGDTTAGLTICLNQININDSNIGNANLEDVKQSNNCGGGAQEPAKEDIPAVINPAMKEDALAKADVAADVAKAKAKEETAEAAKSKPAATDTSAASAALAAQQKAEAAARIEAAAKIEAERKAKADADAKNKADADAKAKADADAKIKADADAVDLRNKIIIGVAIALVIVIIIIIIIISLKSDSREQYQPMQMQMQPMQMQPMRPIQRGQYQQIPPYR